MHHLIWCLVMVSLDSFFIEIWNYAIFFNIYIYICVCVYIYIYMLKTQVEYWQEIDQILRSQPQELYCG